MTDGILPGRGAARTPTCSPTTTIIIDESHERSLTIDFLLGYLQHRLLPRRPDLQGRHHLRDIDPQRFADHFASAVGEDAGRGGLRAHLPGGGPATGRSASTRPPLERRRTVDDEVEGDPDDRGADRSQDP